MALHNDTGAWGEEAASEHYTSQGYAIIERNAHIGGVEIDLVVSHDTEIVFVEVKTRTPHEDDPLAAIDRRKSLRLARAINTYMQDHPELRLDPRIDIVAVTGTPLDFTLDVYPDAVAPPHYIL